MECKFLRARVISAEWKNVAPEQQTKRLVPATYLAESHPVQSAALESQAPCVPLGVCAVAQSVGRAIDTVMEKEFVPPPLYVIMGGGGANFYPSR